MKKIIPILALVALAAQSCSVESRMAKRAPLLTDPAPLQLAADTRDIPFTVPVKYDVALPKNYVVSAAQLIYAPYLTDGERIVPLSKTYVNGPKFVKAEARAAAKGEPITDYTGALRIDGPKTASIISIEDQPIFERWMQDARLVANTLYRTPDGQENLLATAILAEGVQFTPPIVVIDGPTVLREDWTSVLEYAVNSGAINAKLGNNAAELRALDLLISRILARPEVQIRQVVVTGYASPEGPVAQNERLARARATSARDYVQKKLNLPKELYSIETMAENWIGMKALIQTSDLDNKEAIIKIIDSNETPVQKMTKIKALPQYNYIKEKILPLLRMVRIEILFTAVE